MAPLHGVLRISFTYVLHNTIKIPNFPSSATDFACFATENHLESSITAVNLCYHFSLLGHAHLQSGTPEWSFLLDAIAGFRVNLTVVKIGITMIITLGLKDWGQSLPENPRDTVEIKCLKAKLEAGSFVQCTVQDKIIYGRIVMIRKCHEIEKGEIAMVSLNSGVDLDTNRIVVKLNIFRLLDFNAGVNVKKPNGKDLKKVRFSGTEPDGRRPWELQELQQTKSYIWALDDSVDGLIFVFHSEDIAKGRYDPSFMHNAFKCAYHDTEDRESRVNISSREFAAFPCDYRAFNDHIKGKSLSRNIWNSLLTIRGALQHMLCRNAHSQGHTNSEYAKITEESWTYIKEGMKGVCTAETINRNLKKVITEVGLRYSAERDQAKMERLYIDTEEALVQLRSVVGGASVGYGVRKPRPCYGGSHAQRNIHMNDGVHVVNVWDNRGRMKLNDPGRKRIVLTYNREDDRVLVYVSYSFVVLSEQSIIENRLDSIGVVVNSVESADSVSNEEDIIEDIPLDPNFCLIKKGEQFIYPFKEHGLCNNDLPNDGSYLFRVTEVYPQSGCVVARMIWKLNELGVATKRLNPYSNEYIHRFEDAGPVLRAIQQFQHN